MTTTTHMGMARTHHWMLMAAERPRNYSHFIPTLSIDTHSPRSRLLVGTLA
jgi:hypothetical protein